MHAAGARTPCSSGGSSLCLPPLLVNLSSYPPKPTQSPQTTPNPQGPPVGAAQHMHAAARTPRSSGSGSGNGSGSDVLPPSSDSPVGEGASSAASDCETAASDSSYMSLSPPIDADAEAIISTSSVVDADLPGLPDLPDLPDLRSDHHSNRPKGVWGVLAKSCAANVLPYHRDSMPSLERMRASPHNPVLVTPNCAYSGFSLDGREDAAQEIPINSTRPFAIECEHFSVGYDMCTGLHVCACGCGWHGFWFVCFCVRMCACACVCARLCAYVCVACMRVCVHALWARVDACAHGCACHLPALSYRYLIDHLQNVPTPPDTLHLAHFESATPMLSTLQGEMIVHMRNLPTTQAAVFAGKKRMLHCAVQGKFKRVIR